MGGRKVLIIPQHYPCVRLCQAHSTLSGGPARGHKGFLNEKALSRGETSKTMPSMRCLTGIGLPPQFRPNMRRQPQAGTGRAGAVGRTASPSASISAPPARPPPAVVGPPTLRNRCATAWGGGTSAAMAWNLIPPVEGCGFRRVVVRFGQGQEAGLRLQHLCDGEGPAGADLGDLLLSTRQPAGAQPPNMRRSRKMGRRLRRKQAYASPSARSRACSPASARWWGRPPGAAGAPRPPAAEPLRR